MPNQLLVVYGTDTKFTHIFFHLIHGNHMAARAHIDAESLRVNDSKRYFLLSNN